MADEFWEANFGIIPQSVNDADVWRAAHQMLKLFPEDAPIAAAQRADKALEMGDMFNFNLWTRITKAIQEIERQKPGSGEAIN
jgi:hypothetical protein